MGKELIFLFAAAILVFSGCIAQNEKGADGMDLSGKKVLFVIAPSNFRDEELFHTKEALESKGALSAIASSSKGTIKGVMGGSAEATILISEADASDYDAVIFVGGIGAKALFNNPDALALAKSSFSSGKITAAICIAPSILANAGLLKGKKATCFSSEAENLKSKGAIYTGKGVETDGLIITADGPSSARAFGDEIAKKLSQSR